MKDYLDVYNIQFKHRKGEYKVVDIDRYNNDHFLLTIQATGIRYYESWSIKEWQDIGEANECYMEIDTDVLFTVVVPNKWLYNPDCEFAYLGRKDFGNIPLEVLECTVDMSTIDTTIDLNDKYHPEYGKASYYENWVRKGFQGMVGNTDLRYTVEMK